jgi:hypothetical protein
MNRDTARAIERQALALLAPLESDGQLKVAVKGGTIGKTFVNLKIEFAEVGKDGVAESREAADFKAMAKFYGLSADDLGKQFVSRGERFEIVGLKPKSQKFPILGRNRTGKVYKFPAESVKQGLESVTASTRQSPASP